MKSKKDKVSSHSFEKNYPNIAQWVQSYGWIEIGQSDSYDSSFIRALNEGGIVWEGDDDYHSVDEALRDLDSGLEEWLEEQEEEDEDDDEEKD